MAPCLPYPVILGHDFPALMDLLSGKNLCNVVVARAQGSWNECDDDDNSLTWMPFYNSEESENLS